MQNLLTSPVKEFRQERPAVAAYTPRDATRMRPGKPSLKRAIRAPLTPPRFGSAVEKDAIYPY